MSTLSNGAFSLQKPKSKSDLPAARQQRKKEVCRCGRIGGQLGPARQEASKVEVLHLDGKHR